MSGFTGGSSVLRPPHARRVDRRGQALVEFGIIAFVLSAIVAGLLGILVLALGSFQNNIAAENAGRELDGHPVLIEENFRTYFDSDDDDPFPQDEDFENVSAKQVYRFLNEYVIDADGGVLYDESLLVLSPDAYRNDRETFPEINQSLLGQYIFDPDVVPDGASEQGAYRFPGAVVRSERTGNLTVLIPLLPEGEAIGIERSMNVDSDDSAFFYPVSQNWVAPVVVGKLDDGDGFEFQIIMFHPSQPGSMISIERQFDNQGRVVSQTPTVASDQAIIDEVSGIEQLPGEDGEAADYSFATPEQNANFGASTSRGQFGLGETFAFTTTVRPFRLVFETASVFRLGAALNPIAVKYEYLEDGNPGPQLTDVIDFGGGSVEDQSLRFEQRVIDRSTEELRRYTVDPGATDDFDSNFLQLLANDDGIWRVSVSVEFERVGDFTDPDSPEDHRLEIRLYKNDVYERLIAQYDGILDDTRRVVSGDVLTPSIAGDALQVRVFSERASGETYQVRLAGASQANWVSFERIGD